MYSAHSFPSGHNWVRCEEVSTASIFPFYDLCWVWHQISPQTAYASRPGVQPDPNTMQMTERWQQSSKKNTEECKWVRDWMIAVIRKEETARRLLREEQECKYEGEDRNMMWNRVMEATGQESVTLSNVTLEFQLFVLCWGHRGCARLHKSTYSSMHRDMTYIHQLPFLFSAGIEHRQL